jgi:hypothetical protein
MSDIEQQRRSVRALELLGESSDAYDCGGREVADALAARARQECGSDTVTLLIGGMQIGEIPRPDDDEWPEYLAAQQDALARSELALPGEEPS